MRITARRVNGGLALRQAMDARGLGLQSLAKKIEEDWGEPVSFQLLGFLATNGVSGRETTTPRTAELIEDALDVPRGSLFEIIEVGLADEPAQADA